MQFEQLGPYKLGKKLGQGGMGTVYAGIEATTGGSAAIKVLSPSLAAEEGFRVRFEAEIESLKKLKHPNIVRLYGYGEQAGTLFYAMELVEGTSLEEELRAGRRFEWREVTAIAVKLCRALKHAHDHGVIHRDLKPANLLLTAEGDIKLSDFGIARLFGDTRFTADGGVLGTAEYMAPEQADGRTVTDKCDQYSLGGVLYALLAGRPPFRARSLVEMLQLQRFAEPEPLSRYAPQTPAELVRIIHQLLEKDPQNRFVNTLILSRALEAMERGLSISLSRTGDDVLDVPEAAEEDILSESPLAPTMTPAQLAESARGPGTASEGIQSTEATLASAAAAEMRQPAPSRETPERVPPAERFTKVEPEQQERINELAEFLKGLISLQTLALAAGVLVLILGGWYLLQPPTADALFRDIEVPLAEADPDSLRAVQPKIEDFLRRFPDDSRAEKLRAVVDELKQANPVQRAYTEAKRYMLINPELALAKLTALIDVYDDGEANGDVANHYLRLARVQRKRVQKQIDGYAGEGRKLVESRLVKAGQLAEGDPAAAHKIYQGIVELYAEKPWAADLVARARAALTAQRGARAAAQ